jgi:hypothetical protein
VSDIPSIKGSLLAVSIGQLKQLRDRGVIEDDDVEAAIGAEHLALVTSGGVSISRWYPADLYDRLLTLMMRHAGNGKPEYLVEQGRQVVATMVESGIYAQFALEGAISRGMVRKIISLSSVMYNFTTWDVGDVRPEEGWFQIVVSDAARYPESFRWRNIGFIEAMVGRATGSQCHVTSERERPDRIVFTVRLRDTRG